MIEVITFPRSGHHWLMRGIEQRCGLEPGWHCDIHKEQPTESTLIVKTHDFELSHVPRHPYVVQIRQNVLHALQSWFDLYVHDKLCPDTQEAWDHFATWSVEFAAVWYAKWTRSPSLIIYEEMIEHGRDRYIETIADRLGLECSGAIQKEIHSPRTGAFRHKVDAQKMQDRFMEIFTQ
jgi:hypothetical protein